MGADWGGGGREGGRWMRGRGTGWRGGGFICTAAITSPFPEVTRKPIHQQHAADVHFQAESNPGGADDSRLALSVEQEVFTS